MSAAGYGTIAPDMLGFGASDMPTEPEAYDTKRLSDHLIELLDHENLGTVIAVGHDWGVVVLSRLAGFYPERLEKIVFVNVGHLAPGGFLDLDAINAQGLRDYGYMPYGYWYFFNRYDASSVIDAHVSPYAIPSTILQTHLFLTQYDCSSTPIGT
jgi:soluble epoxide hydrolase / lipid-phosphate phosphatase